VIFSITPFTLLDFPNKTACVLWFAGCNMRCVYCYNPEIVIGKGKISFSEVVQFLQKRKHLLDGVVLSGGECTLHKNIDSYIEEIKQMGFDIKIDTNGSSPKVIERLLQKNLIDYVALDFKSMLNNFESITKSNLFNNFQESLRILNKGQISFEVRTTIHSDLLLESDIQKMINYLENENYMGTYYLQQFVNNTETLGHIQNSKVIHITKKLKSRLKIELRN
jgi:pyruvate formate lyase activating enzyme